MKLTNRNFFLPVLLFILPSGHCHRILSLNDISEILGSGINNNYQPCIDFYKHACGNWIQNNEKPETALKWGVTEMSEAIGYTMIRDMLEEKNISQNNVQALSEKKFYDACTDYSRVDGRNLFRRMLSETENSDWTNVMKYYANKIGELLLFGIKLNEENYLQIGAPVNATSIKKVSNLDKLFELYEGTSLTNNPAELRTFMSYISQLTLNARPRMEKMTILEMQTYFEDYCFSLNPQVNWLEIFQKLANGSEMNFTNSDFVYVDQEYIEKLCYILEAIPESAIVNYLHYNFIMADEAYTYVDVPFDSKSGGIRSIFCVEHLPISDGIYHEFLESFISKEITDMVISIVVNLKEALLEEIENSWMMGPLKMEAQQTVRDFNFQYTLRFNRHAKSLQHLSYDFETDPIGLQLLMNFKKAQMKTKMNVYLEAKNIRGREEFGTRKKRYMKAVTCYMTKNNAIYIDSTILFPPVFHLNAPIGFNYGRLAFIIGHEMSHAFDYENMEKRLDCYNSAHKEKFEKILEDKKNCFVKEFDQFNISGIDTIDENIPDQQGIKLAFKAMKKLMNEDKNLNHERLPNFEHVNQEKLFFLSYANQWCQNPEIDELPRNSGHSPDKFRIQGILRNSYEFARTFNCDNQDYMNPEPKCDLWSKPNFSPIDDSLLEASEF